MTYEFEPSQARVRGCDPVAAIHFLYNQGYKYVYDTGSMSTGESQSTRVEVSEGILSCKGVPINDLP